MDRNEKLFRKLSKKDRAVLRELVELLMAGGVSQTHIKKLRGSNFYRLRKGRFRIIFHYDKAGRIEIDSIRLRDSDTYKHF